MQTAHLAQTTRSPARYRVGAPGPDQLKIVNIDEASERNTYAMFQSHRDKKILTEFAQF
jgi:hypothetical protein